MQSSLHSLLTLGGAVALALGGLNPARAQLPRPDVAQALEGVEVQARGPVHEAFAQPAEVRPEPGPMVPQAPPEPVPELPPEQQPEGANVQWIDGYWAWDADRNDFLWVSGVYRNTPPSRRYVSGYWEQTPDGWRWVAGFWAPDAQQQLPYLPEPPASLENGPSLPPPDDNSFYVPGTWAYRDTRYLWQPGFYTACRPGQMWVPASYAWTPGGCVFVPGYWDFPLENRGLLFAPVVFTQPLWRTPGWYYRPSYVVGPGPLLNAFFVRPAWRHYYYGDYYGARYAGLGFRPWYAYGARYRDPLYGYYRWQNRGDPNWQPGLRQLYVDRAAGRAPLPPRTLAQQNFARNSSLRMVTPLNQFQSQNVRLTRATATQVHVQRTNAQNMRQAAVVRSRTERAFAVRGPGGGVGGQGRVLNLPAHGPQAGPGAPKGFAPPRTSGFQPKGPAVRPQPRASFGQPTAPAHQRPSLAQSPVAHAAPRAFTQPKAAAYYRPAPAQPRGASAAPKTYRPASVAPRAAPAARPQPVQRAHATTYRPAPRPASHVAPRPAPRPAPHPAPSGGRSGGGNHGGGHPGHR